MTMYPYTPHVGTPLYPPQQSGFYLSTSPPLIHQNASTNSLISTPEHLHTSPGLSPSSSFENHPQGISPQGTLPQVNHPQGPHSQGIPSQALHSQGIPSQGPHPQGIPSQGPHPQGIPSQGLHPQGILSQGLHPQGIPSQGLHPQGIPSQGSHPQGISSQGSHPQGIPSQGSHTQGIPSQGSHPQGTPAQGTPAHGTHPQGNLSQGAVSQGSLSHGTLPQGSLPQGTVSQGTLPQGTIPQGAIPQGTIPQGTIPQGTVPQGTVPLVSHSQETYGQGTHSQETHGHGPHSQETHVQATHGQETHGQGAHGQETHGQGSHTQGSHTQSSHAQGSHTQGSHTQGSHTQSSHAQGSHTQGSHTQGSHTQGSHTQGSHTQGSHTQGSHTQGSHTQGSHTQGSHTQGSHTQGSHTQGSHTQGSHTQGSHGPGTHAQVNQAQGSHVQATHTQGMHSQTSLPQGPLPQGTHIQGAHAQATLPQNSSGQGTHLFGTHIHGNHGQATHSQTSHSQGTYSQGTHTQTVYGQGTHAQGTYNQGSHAQGSRSQGTVLQRSHSQGTHTQGNHSQGTHSQGILSQESHSQGPHSQGVHSQGTHLQKTHPPKTQASSSSSHPWGSHTSTHVSGSHTPLMLPNMYTSFPNSNASLLLPSPSVHHTTSNTSSGHTVNNSYIGSRMPFPPFLSTHLSLFNSSSPGVVLSKSAPLSTVPGSSYTPQQYSFVRAPASDASVLSVANHSVNMGTPLADAPSQQKHKEEDFSCVKDVTVSLGHHQTNEEKRATQDHETAIENVESCEPNAPLNDKYSQFSSLEEETQPGSLEDAPCSTTAPSLTTASTQEGSRSSPAAESPIFTAEGGFQSDSGLLLRVPPSTNGELQQNEEVRLGISSDLMVFPSLTQFLMRSHTTPHQEIYEPSSFEFGSDKRRSSKQNSRPVSAALESSTPVSCPGDDIGSMHSQTHIYDHEGSASSNGVGGRTTRMQDQQHSGAHDPCESCSLPFTSMLRSSLKLHMSPGAHSLSKNGSPYVSPVEGKNMLLNSSAAVSIANSPSKAHSCASVSNTTSIDSNLNGNTTNNATLDSGAGSVATNLVNQNTITTNSCNGNNSSMCGSTHSSNRATSRKPLKKRRVCNGSADSPVYSGSKFESPGNKSLSTSYSEDPSRNIASSFQYSNVSRQGSVVSTAPDSCSEPTQSFPLLGLTSLMGDLVTSGNILDPMGLYGKSSANVGTCGVTVFDAVSTGNPSSAARTAEEGKQSGTTRSLSSLVKQICSRYVERRRDLNDLSGFVHLDAKSVSSISDDVDQPPPLASTHSDLQLARLVEASEREMRLLTMQQHCFRLLKNISLCCQPWANHEGSYPWHVCFVLGATSIGEIARYCLIFEDIVCDITLKLKEAENKIASFSLNSTTQGGAAPRPQNDPKPSEPQEESPCFPPPSCTSSTVKPPSSWTSASTVSFAASSCNVDCSGALLTSLVHQVDSTTMAQCLMLLDGLRQQHDPCFQPLPSLQDTLSCFVALQALHAMHQSPVNFLLGSCSRFRSAADLGAGRSGKKRSVAASNVAFSSNVSLSVPCANSVPQFNQKTKTSGRTKKQSNVTPTTSLHAGLPKPSTTANPESTSALQRTSDSDGCTKVQQYTGSGDIAWTSPPNDRCWVGQRSPLSGVNEDMKGLPLAYSTQRENASPDDDWEDSDEKSCINKVCTTQVPSTVGCARSVRNSSSSSSSSYIPTSTHPSNTVAGESSNIAFPHPLVPGKSMDFTTSGEMSPSTVPNSGTSVASRCNSLNATSQNSTHTTPDAFELPRDPEAFRSQVKGVYYDDTSNRWCASWHERKTGKKKSRYFAVKKFGFSTAKTNAMDARLEAEESGECAPTNII